MYLLFRVFNEHEVNSVVEFGSGQTTLLIDRIKSAGPTTFAMSTGPIGTRFSRRA